MRENFDDEGKEHLKTENKKKEKRQIVITLMLMKKNS